MKDLAFALVLGLVAGVAGTGSPPAVPQYAASIHDARVALDRVSERPSISTAQVRPIQRDLASLRRVRLPDGRVMATGTPRLAMELTPADRASVRTVARALDSLDDGLQGSGSRPPNGVQLATLDDVLRDSRFHPQRTLWQEITDWVGGVLSGILRGAHLSTDRTMALLAGLLLLVLVVGIGTLAARGALRRVVVEAQPGRRPEPVGSVAAQAEARHHARDGNFRAALRYLFLGTLLALQEGGALELRPGMTNREYLQAVRDDSAIPGGLREPLQSLVDVFDRVWYGHAPFDADDYATCESLAHRALASLPEERAA